MSWHILIGVYICSIVTISIGRQYDPPNSSSCDLEKCGKYENSICIDGKCNCKPDYPYNSTTEQCEYLACRLDEECVNGQNISRVCDNGQCVCPLGYSESPTGLGACVLVNLGPAKGGSCFSDNECFPLDTHKRCIDEICQCDFNYIQGYYGCEKFDCSIRTYSCAQDYDWNRVCRNGACQCISGYHQLHSNGLKCTEDSYTNYSDPDTDFSTWWVILLCVLILVLFILILACYIRRRRKIQKRRRRFRRMNSSRHNFMSNNSINRMGQPVSLVPITYDENRSFNYTSFQNNRDVYDPPPSYESIPGPSNQIPGVNMNSSVDSNSAGSSILLAGSELEPAQNTMLRSASNNQLSNSTPSKLEQMLAMQL